MRTLVPPFILDQVEHNTPTGSIEAAVLLIDATGSTALASSLRVSGIQGAEILASITWDVFAPQVDAVLRHGGFVGGFTGDGFVALFPGDPAFAIPRALATARAIRRHMETCSIHHHEFGESHFDVKAAIAHGEVTWHIWHSPVVADGQSAVDHYLEGIKTDRAIGRRRGEAFSQHGLGCAYLDIEAPELATVAFSADRQIRIEIDEAPHATESLGSLVAVAMANGQTDDAIRMAEEVRGGLDVEFWVGANEPFRVYHICIRILMPHDPVATESLRADALANLEQRASRISGANDRIMYMDNVARRFGFSLG